MSVFQYNLFVAVDDGKFLQSASGGGEFVLPKLKVGDCVPLNVQLIRRTGPLTSPIYTIIDPAGLALSIGIGTEGGTPSALQTSWTVVDQFFTGTLDLTSGALATAVSNGSALFLEIKVADSMCYQRVYHSPISLVNPVIPASASNPTPTASYNTRDEDNAIFTKKVGLAGESITLTSPDGSKQVLIYVANDGSFHADLVT